MDHVGIIVHDLRAAAAFFVGLGLEAGSKEVVEGDWVDRVVGIDDVRAEIVMVSTPDGRGRLELTRYFAPVYGHPDAVARANRLGIRHVAFVVDDLDDALARVRARGLALVGEVQQYEDAYRLCYVRGPEGIIVELAEELAA